MQKQFHKQRHEAQYAFPRLTPVIHETPGAEFPAGAHYTELILPVNNGLVKHNCIKQGYKSGFCSRESVPAAPLVKKYWTVRNDSVIMVT